MLLCWQSYLNLESIPLSVCIYLTRLQVDTPRALPGYPKVSIIFGCKHRHKAHLVKAERVIANCGRCERLCRRRAISIQQLPGMQTLHPGVSGHCSVWQHADSCHAEQ